MTKVKIITREGKTVVVQYRLNDATYRSVVEADEIKDGEIEDVVLHAAPMAGDDFEQIAGEVVNELGEGWLEEEIQKTLNNAGIWTIEDLTERRSEAKQLLLGIVGKFIHPFFDAVAREKAEK